MGHERCAGVPESSEISTGSESIVQVYERGNGRLPEIDWPAATSLRSHKPDRPEGRCVLCCHKNLRIWSCVSFPRHGL